MKRQQFREGVIYVNAAPKLLMRWRGDASKWLFIFTAKFLADLRVDGWIAICKPRTALSEKHLAQPQPEVMLFKRFTSYADGYVLKDFTCLMSSLSER